jgi:hypothetical protein
MLARVERHADAGVDVLNHRISGIIELLDRAVVRLCGLVSALR